MYLDDEEKRLKKFEKIAKFNSTLVENMQTLSSMNEYYRWLAGVLRKYVGKRKRVLDVGCANGNLTQFFLDKEFILGMDISQDYLDAVKKRFKDNANFHTALVDASNAEQMLKLKKGNFDMAITMNVLEHIKDDVSAFRNVYSALVPGGRFLIIVPAMSALYAILDYEGGHYRRYDKLEIKRKLRAAGFNIVKVRYLNVPGAIGWYVNYTLLKKRLFSKGTFGLYNKLVPFFRFIENLIEFPFGMSVIAVAEKPHSAKI